MKVEVSIVKKTGKKVEVTLARSKHRGQYIPVPVRVAQKPAEIEDIIAEPVIEAEETYDFYTVCEDQLDPSPTLSEATEISADEEYLYDDDPGIAEEVNEDADDDIDEDELLALIAEEEAEMAAQQNNASTEGSSIGYAAREYADDSADDEYVNELASEVQELVDEFGSEGSPSNIEEDDAFSDVEAQDIVDELNLIDEIFDNCDVIEDGECTVEEAQELVDETALDFELNEDSFDKYGGKSSDSNAATEQYMRYFDRSTSGERVEVEDPNATGQEIICVDGESGRISRVCGFIKHEKSAPLPAVENLTSDEN